MRSRFVIAFIATLLILAILFNSASVSVSSGVRDPLGLVGLYVEYECPPVTFINKYAYNLYGNLQSDFPPAIFLAKYYNTDFYKSIIDRWGNDIMKIWRGTRSALKDPDMVASALSEIADGLYKSGYTVRYNLSFHVVGFDGEFYDIVLRLKISVVNTRNLSIVLYDSSYVEERVKVSIRDRSMIYNGSYAGIWPFFLLPWEIYEGSNIVLSDLILYDIFGVELPIDRINATLEPVDLNAIEKDDLQKRFWEYWERYFREVVGITIRPESILTATFVLSSNEQEFVRRWVDAADEVERKFYESLGFTSLKLSTPRKNYPTGVFVLMSFMYDVKSGIASIFIAGIHELPDVLSYVFPINRLFHGLSGSGCIANTWYLRSLKFITPESSGSPEVTTPYPTVTVTTNTGVEVTTTVTGVQEETTIVTSPTTVIATSPMDKVGETRVPPRAIPTQTPVATPTVTPMELARMPTPRSRLLDLEVALMVLAVLAVVSLAVLYVRFLRR